MDTLEYIPWPAIVAVAVLAVGMVYLVCAAILAGRRKHIKTPEE